jgi:protein phosphatase 1 regulatory subunit 7
VLPEPDVSLGADQDTDEEPIEEAKIEEHEEEGNFLEDFPDDTEVSNIPSDSTCNNPDP